MSNGNQRKHKAAQLRIAHRLQERRQSEKRAVPTNQIIRTGVIVASSGKSNRYLKVSEIGLGVKISNLLLKNCVPEIDNNSINNHRSIMILTLLNSGRQDLSNGTIVRSNFVVREKSKNNLWLRPPGAVPAAEAADSAPVARG